MKQPYFFMILLFVLLYTGCELTRDSQKTKDQADEIDSVMSLELTNLKLLDRIINVGKVNNDTTLTAKFYFQNTGKSDLIIESVQPDCTCTGYKLSDETLAQGEKGYLELMMDTKGKYGDVAVNAIIKANTADKFYNVKLKAIVVD